jgi:hypothetical protein
LDYKPNEIKGLKWRFAEQITGQNGPCSQVWVNHENKIKEQQRNLQKKLNDYERNNCGSKIPLPIGAYSWANKPAISPKEWIGPNLDPTTKSILQTGATAAILYGTYKIGKIAIGAAVAGPPGAVIMAVTP